MNIRRTRLLVVETTPRESLLTSVVLTSVGGMVGVHPRGFLHDVDEG